MDVRYLLTLVAEARGLIDREANITDSLNVRGTTTLAALKTLVVSYGLRLTHADPQPDGSFDVTVTGDRRDIEHFERDNE